MERLAPPQQFTLTSWESYEVIEALQKSRAALFNNLNSTSTNVNEDQDLLMKLANVENLFLVDTAILQLGKQTTIFYASYGEGMVKRGAWEWGSKGNFSRSATAAVVDALSRSGLPFFQIQYLASSRKNPAIEAQVKRNQRNFLLGLDSTRVSATSMRLFICGDPFAGKQITLSLKH